MHVAESTDPATRQRALRGPCHATPRAWIGAYRFVEEISDALTAMRDGLDVSAVITHRFDLDRAAEALSVAADPSSHSSKVMLRLDTEPDTQ